MIDEKTPVHIRIIGGDERNLRLSEALVEAFRPMAAQVAAISEALAAWAASMRPAIEAFGAWAATHEFVMDDEDGVDDADDV